MSNRAVSDDRVYTCDLCAYQQVSEKLPPRWVKFDMTTDLVRYALGKRTLVMTLPPARVDIEVCHVCAEPFVRLLPELAMVGGSRDV